MKNKYGKNITREKNGKKITWKKIPEKKREISTKKNKKKRKKIKKIKNTGKKYEKKNTLKNMGKQVREKIVR